MAQVAAVKRTIIIPQADPAQFDEFGLPGRISQLINAGDTKLGVFTFSYIEYYAFQSGNWLPGRAVKLEFLLTQGGDTSVVARLPALQQSLGLTDPLPTWAETMTYGY